MNKNKYYLAVAVLGLLITTAGVSAIAGATDNDVSSRLTAYPERAEKFQEHRDEMKQSLDNKDYDAWKSLLADKVSEDKLTEENFNNHLQMHELMLAGDFKGAKALAEELDLDELGHGKAYKKGFRDGRAFGEKRCQAEI